MSVTRDVQPSLGLGAPDRPVGPILPSVFQGTNADLMAAVAPLYLTGSVLDVTYGEGKWWDRFTPDPFTFHDLYKVDGVDFRDLPEADSSVDTVCFDPPYVIAGGRSADPALAAFDDRYGINDTNIGGGEVLTTIDAGTRECCRVAGHWLLVKCMEFAQGGKFHDVPNYVTNTASSLGLVLHDRIVHHTGSGPGGHNIFDVKRARRHHSYLLVFEVPS